MNCFRIDALRAAAPLCFRPLAGMNCFRVGDTWED